MHHFVTGAAGFIGSHLVERLLAGGDTVSGADDFSIGRSAHLEAARTSSRFRFIEADLSSPDETLACLRAASQWAGPPDLVWHLAANSDIPAGLADPRIDFRRTLQTTFATLEAARACGTRRLAFASTSAVYGERSGPLTEDSGPLLPISGYGGAKLASEALVSAAAETSLSTTWIFRFPNVVGARATHGVIVDLIDRLSSNPSRLRVLGDGAQTKPYLHVDELLTAMQFIVARASGPRNVFNIGPPGSGTTVAFIANAVVERVMPGTPIEYTGGDRGWIGDVPRFQYSTDRLTRMGWSPRLSSDEAVCRAIDELAPATVRQR